MVQNLSNISHCYFISTAKSNTVVCKSKKKNFRRIFIVMRYLLMNFKQKVIQLIVDDFMFGILNASQMILTPLSSIALAYAVIVLVQMDILRYWIILSVSLLQNSISWKNLSAEFKLFAMLSLWSLKIRLFLLFL